MKKQPFLLESFLDIFVGLLLLLAAWLVGCQAAAAPAAEPVAEANTQRPADDVPAQANLPIPTTVPTPAAEPDAISPPPVTNDESTDTEAAENTAEVRPEPEIGQIVFALGATPAYEPVEAGLLFTKGITEVHAIFEYSGMSPDYTWERVWYLNDKVIARISEPWSGPEAGKFDYFIDNRGNALPAGDWVLELYVERELKALGVFVITDAGIGPQSGPYPLVYTRCEGDHHDIYVADTAGQNEQLLVQRGAGPSWSPGGGAVFFYGEAGVDRQARNGFEVVFDGISNGIVLMRAYPLPTTLDQLNLFQGSEWKQGTARWAKVSPDGSMVAYDAKPSGDYRIYFLGTASNQQFRYEIIGEQADWSPDSQKIVYRSGRDGRTGLWLSDRTDSGHTLLSGGGSDSFPAWSPDGQTVVFSREEGGNVDIYAVNVDGGNLRRLTTAPGHDTLPTYAPNGDIIFRSARTGSWGIWKMTADGSEQVEIIPNACVGNDWAYSRMDVLD